MGNNLNNLKLKKLIFLVVVLVFFISCKNRTSEILKEKEIAIKTFAEPNFTLTEANKLIQTR